MTESALQKMGVEARDVVFSPHPGSQYNFLRCPVYEALYEGTRGPGKRILDTNKVLTDSGWKLVGDVSMYDRLVAIDGTYTEILSIHKQSSGAIYKVTFDDGAALDVDGDHLWTVFGGTNGWRDGWVVRSTADLIASKEKYWSIPTMTAPAPGKEWRGLDPYAIGLMLGDGTTGSRDACLYSADDELIEHMVATHGWRRYKYDSSVCARAVETRKALSNDWKDAVGRGKAADKRVDSGLLEADPATRLAVLQGLMDSDGSADKEGRCRFVSLSEHLAKGTQYLVRSLGGKSTCYWESRPSPKGGVDGRWRVNVVHCGKFNPFRIARKAGRVKPMQGVNRRIVSIVEIGDGPATCFAVDHPSSLFVAQDFIVTHNTAALLMDFAQHVGQGFGANWRGVLFRETYPQLSDVLAKSKALFYRAFPGVKFNSSDYVWTWPTGEQLYFRHMRVEDDYWNYHGHEYPWIGWEELTNWADGACYDSMKSCSRSSHPDMPRKYRSTANPYGIGHSWVKRYFIDVAPPGVVFNDGGMDRVRIKGYFFENKTLMKSDPEYVTRLMSIADPNKRKAWLGADWNIVSGGMFDGVWREEVHMIKPFEIPKGWRISRSFDWGSSAPFSVGWWATSNGTDLYTGDTDDNGEPTRRSFPRGTKFRIAEWYGWTGKDNEGCRMLASEIGRGIKKREDEMGLTGKVIAGPADTSIFETTNGVCIADDMARAGIRWERADKGPGSRKNGWEKVRDMFAACLDFPMERPGLFVFNTCRHFIRTVPSLPRDKNDPDDVDCFVAGTMVDTSHGPVAVELIQVGDVVMTPVGPRRVIAAGLSGLSQTVAVTLANGAVLRGTPDHQVMVEGCGLVELAQLQCGQTLIGRTTWLGVLNIGVWSTVATMVAATTFLAALCSAAAARLFTGKSGLTLTGRSRADSWCITSTTTTTTTRSKILRWLIAKSTRECTFAFDATRESRQTRLGPIQSLAGINSGQTREKCAQSNPPSRRHGLRVPIVERILRQHIQQPKRVARHAQQSLSLESSHAKSAASSFAARLTARKKCGPVVMRVDGHSGVEEVFCMTVEQAHLFFANGILATNTDAEDHVGDETRYECTMPPRLAVVQQLNL